MNTTKIRKRLFDKYNGKCAYCGKELQANNLRSEHTYMTIDHIDAAITCDKIENLNPSCKSCNKSKGSKNLEQYRKYLIHKAFGLSKFTKLQKEWIKLTHGININNDEFFKFIKDKYKFYFEKIK